MNSIELLAKQIERIGISMAHFVSTTAPGKLNWRPEFAGAAELRTVLELVSECVGVNRLVAKVLRGETVETWEWPEVDYESAEAANQDLIASAQELAEVIRSLSEADLDRNFPHPIAGEVMGANLAIGPYRNMSYHAGQINLIQMLAGDGEFHAPPNWRN